MTAELLGWVGAVGAISNKFIVTARDCWTRGRSPIVPVPSLSRRFAGGIALHGERGFTLTELMEKLTTGKAAALISPDYDDPGDHRPIFDWMSVINGGGIVYNVCVT